MARRALTVVLLAAACQAPSPTGILVEVGSDLRVPQEIDRIVIRVSGGGAPLDRILPLGSRADYYTLPTRLAIEPGAGDPETVDVDVVGRLGQADVVSRRARLRFVRGSLQRWFADLDRQCLGVRCGDGHSCDPGAGCVGPEDALLESAAEPAPPRGGQWIQRSTEVPPEVADPDSSAVLDPDSGRILAASIHGLWEWRGDSGIWLRRVWFAAGWIRPKIFAVGAGKFVVTESDMAYLRAWECDLDRASVSPLLGHESHEDWVGNFVDSHVFLDGVRRNIVAVRADGVVWQWSLGERRWTRHPPALRLSITGPRASAFDSQRAEAVLLSRSGAPGRGSTYHWDGSMLAHVGPAPGNDEPLLVYDEQRARILAFSHVDLFDTGRPPRYANVDSWDPTTRTWNPLEVQGQPAMAGGAIARSSRGDYLFFGGYLEPLARSFYGDTGRTTESAVYTDGTRVFDPATGTWWERTPPHRFPSPIGRVRNHMVYDRVRDRFLMFGGRRHDKGVLTDAWEWQRGER